MHRTDAPGNVAGMYDAGDPIEPREATLIMPEALNSFQEEIIAPIEAAGIPLVKGTNNQLNAALQATYGRLGYVNTWTGSNAFNGGLTTSATSAVSFGHTLAVAGNTTVGGTFGVTGNTSLGGTLGVTGTTTLSGPVNLNGIVTVNAATTVNNSLSVTGSLSATNASNTIQNLTVTNALGVGGSANVNGGLTATSTAGNPGLTVSNGTAATASVPRNALTCANGYLNFSAAATPNGNVAFQNVVTPANIPKAWVNVSVSNGTVTVNRSFNVQSVVLGSGASAGRLVITFAQPFADAFYVPKPCLNGLGIPYAAAMTAQACEMAAYNGADGSASSFATTTRTLMVSFEGVQ